LNNPASFNRPHRVPTLAANEPGYRSTGDYWLGSVWAPTNTMVIRGLEASGYGSLARDIGQNHLDQVARVFEKTGTIWENYMPDTAKPGQPAKPDFAGWSALGPILYLLEFQIGLQPNAVSNELRWALAPNTRHGCERFRFNGHVTTLIAAPIQDRSGAYLVTVESDSDFRLLISHNGSTRRFDIQDGQQTFEIE